MSEVEPTGPGRPGSTADEAPGYGPPADRVADVVLTLLLTAIFAWAFLEAGNWTPRASLFPRLVTGAGFLLSLAHLVVALLGLRPGASQTSGIPEPVAEDDADREEIEYVFGTAGARAWGAALAWIAVFFVTLYVAGLFITAPLFSVLYLRFAGGRTWLTSVVYALVLGGALYLVFEVLLGVPSPEGLVLQ
jgi:hypothetical protein